MVLATVIAMVGAAVPPGGVAANTPDDLILTAPTTAFNAGVGAAASSIDGPGDPAGVESDGDVGGPVYPANSTGDATGSHTELDASAWNAYLLPEQLTELMDGDASGTPWWAPPQAGLATLFGDNPDLSVAGHRLFGPTLSTSPAKPVRRSASRPSGAAAAARTPRRSQRAASAWNVAPIVTWYGPGFYNKRTACGERYTRRIIGVAHRTLPCGTLIEFRWHGMTAVAPVIDRGPYASSAYVFDWSAQMACNVFRPKGVSNSCYTRFNVQWRVLKMGH